MNEISKINKEVNNLNVNLINLKHLFFLINYMFQYRFCDNYRTLHKINKY